MDHGELSAGRRLQWWMPKWRSHNNADGYREHLMQRDWRTDAPLMFHTRAACRKYIAEQWGYLASRADLRAEPHGWLMPVAVKVFVVEQIRGGFRSDPSGEPTKEDR
jgi:hypothetical protein